MSPEKTDHTGTLEDIVGRFEVAWDRGEPPAVEDFITDAGPLRKQILPELLLIDLEFRFKAGMSVRVEDYLNRYPELGEDPAAVVALVVAEYRFRSRSNPSENQQAYLQRFPKYRELLASKFGKQQPVAHPPRGEETVAFSGTDRTPKLAAVPRFDRRSLPADVVGLLDVLQELQILTGQQSSELAGVVSDARDAPGVIAELERRGSLTAYQADALRKNRSKQLVFGSYVLLEPLGKGGMGQVFKARHRVMKRLVALKIIRKGHLPHGEAVQRFAQEIEAAAKLAHPNIVTSHDAGRSGDFHFFVMELVEGIGLDALLKKQGQLPIGIACELIRQTALGLQHSHDQGLVHRDIKPQNLILDKLGTVKILDMGLARVRYDPAGGGARALTQMGAVMGTADYIAPEQILDCSRVDGRADIYSLGCTFYQLLTGQPPFPGNDLRRKLEQHMKGEVRPAEDLRADLPPEVRAILRKMLARKPDERYAFAAEVASALAPFSTMAAAGTVIRASDAVADSNPADETFVENPPLAKIAPPVAYPSQTVPAQPHKRRLSSVGIIAILLGVGGPVVGMLIGIVMLAVVFWPKSPTNKQPDPVLSHLDQLKAEDIPANLRAGLPEDAVGILGDGAEFGPVSGAAFSPDGSHLISAHVGDSRKPTPSRIRVWDLRSRQELYTMDVPFIPSAITVTADGSKAAAVSILNEGKFLAWDLRTGRKLFEGIGHFGILKFTPDGKHLLSGQGAAETKLYDASGVDKGKIDAPVFAYRGGIDVSSDGAWVVRSTIAGPEKYPVAIFFAEIPSGKLIHSHSFKNEGYGRVRLSPDNRYLYTTDVEEGKLRIWELNQKKEMKETFVQADSRLNKSSKFPQNNEDYNLALSPDGKTVLTSDTEGNVIQWSVPDGKKVKMWNLSAPNTSVFDVAPDSRHAVIGRTDGRVLILRLAN